MNTLDAILETWTRNTNIVLNILNALPDGGIDARDTDARGENGLWTVAHHLADMQSTNLAWLNKSSPEFAVGLKVLYHEDSSLPAGFDPERNISTIKTAFQNSNEAVARAVRHHVETNTAFGDVYAHPIFFVQHMLWHQAYHIGQIMWALKQSKMRFSDDQAFEMIWKELRR